MLITYKCLSYDKYFHFSVPGQPLLRFQAEAWLPFRNCEVDYQFIYEEVSNPIYSDSE